MLRQRPAHTLMATSNVVCIENKVLVSTFFSRSKWSMVWLHCRRIRGWFRRYCQAGVRDSQGNDHWILHFDVVPTEDDVKILSVLRQSTLTSYAFYFFRFITIPIFTAQRQNVLWGKQRERRDENGREGMERKGSDFLSLTSIAKSCVLYLVTGKFEYILLFRKSLPLWLSW